MKWANTASFTPCRGSLERCLQWFTTARSAVQAEALSIPLLNAGVREYHELHKRGVTVDWRGRLVAPPGALDAAAADGAGSPSDLASRDR